jgi:hypothetical protein
MSAFGPLPEQGKIELLAYIYFLVQAYRDRLKTTPTPSKEGNQFKKIETTTRRLLMLIGVNCDDTAFPRFRDNPPNFTLSEQVGIVGSKPDSTESEVLGRLSIAGIDAGMDVELLNAKAAAAIDRGKEAARLLLWLRSQAKLAEQSVQPQKGRGGHRNRPKANGVLIRSAIDIYVRMCEQYPNSGNKPGYRAPMLRFIGDIAALAGATLTDCQIREVWKGRNSKQK